MPVLNERRKFVRHLLPYGMLYIFDHYSTKVGWVRDVGMGGLSFEFNHEDDAVRISEVIDIFAYDHERFYIPSVSCQKTFVLSMGTKRLSTNRWLRHTRCGQHFVSLTHEQQARWKELIEKFSKYSDLFFNFYNPFT